MSEILLGTCGWSYAEWEGILYPQKSGKLKQYSSIFPTTEIDSTFYALPDRQTVLGWVRHTPSNFTFSAKLPQAITHKKAIDSTKGIEIDLNRFLEAMGPLLEADRLACVLAQLPPFLRFDSERLESFLSLLPEKPSFAVEFRHISWLREETFKLLERYQVAYTIVDEPLLPPDVYVTSGISYIRWHGRGSRPWFNYRYSQRQLEEWAPKVQEVAGRVRKVLGYFNNHFHGYAPENCLQIMQMLGIVTPHSTAALRRLAFFRKEGKPLGEMRSLEAWTGPTTEKIVEKLLLNFAEVDTLEAARLISDTDFSLREDSKSRLAAYIVDTTVEIDFQERRIVHYCPIWDRSIIKSRFCPHVVKLFLSIDPKKARSILSSIHSTLSNWKFESRLSVGLPT
jgi:uncharacterized protein YecE (DUF72 family)